MSAGQHLGGPSAFFHLSATSAMAEVRLTKATATEVPPDCSSTLIQLRNEIQTLDKKFQGLDKNFQGLDKNFQSLDATVRSFLGAKGVSVFFRFCSSSSHTGISRILPTWF